MQQLIRALGNDEELLTDLADLGLVRPRPDGYTRVEVERALVSYTLVRELGVNWEGVEVALRLREELLDTRRQVERLLQLLRDSVASTRGEVTHEE
jgi:hypothetical protein